MAKAETTATQRARKHTPSEFVIQIADASSIGPTGPIWIDLDTKGFTMADTADAVRYIKDNQVVGILRVISVKKQFTTKKVEKTELLFG